MGQGPGVHLSELPLPGCEDPPLLPLPRLVVHKEVRLAGQCALPAGWRGRHGSPQVC